MPDWFPKKHPEFVA